MSIGCVHIYFRDNVSNTREQHNNIQESGVDEPNDGRLASQQPISNGLKEQRKYWRDFCVFSENVKSIVHKTPYIVLYWRIVLYCIVLYFIVLYCIVLTIYWYTYAHLKWIFL